MSQFSLLMHASRLCATSRCHGKSDESHPTAFPCVPRGLQSAHAGAVEISKARRDAECHSSVRAGNRTSCRRQAGWLPPILEQDCMGGALQAQAFTGASSPAQSSGPSYGAEDMFGAWGQMMCSMTCHPWVQGTWDRAAGQ